MKMKLQTIFLGIKQTPPLKKQQKRHCFGPATIYLHKQGKIFQETGPSFRSKGEGVRTRILQLS